MATIVIPEAVQDYFPKTIDPSQLWVNYDSKADSLTVYFTGKPVPSIWTDIDQYAYVGFAPDDTKLVTGVMIEHFSRWLLVPGHSEHVLSSS
jgi:hypothetical protein